MCILYYVIKPGDYTVITWDRGLLECIKNFDCSFVESLVLQLSRHCFPPFLLGVILRKIAVKILSFPGISKFFRLFVKGLFNMTMSVQHVTRRDDHHDFLHSSFTCIVVTHRQNVMKQMRENLVKISLSCWLPYLEAHGTWQLLVISLVTMSRIGG